MKKNIVLFCFAISILFMTNGCKKDGTDDTVAPCTNDGSTNFPFMAEGHISKYYYQQILSYPDTITYTIGAESNGRYPVTAKYLVHPSANSSTHWWACGNEYYEESINDPHVHYSFSLDSKVGDTWTRVSGDTATYELLSKNASVTTQDLGQTFTNCYQIAITIKDAINTDTIYFKPDVGEVYYNGLLFRYEMFYKNF